MQDIGMKKIYSKIRKLYIKSPIVLVLFSYTILVLLFVPKFAHPNNILDILVQSADLIIFAIGLTFVLLNGGIDFSIFSIVGLVSILGAMIMNKDSGLLSSSHYGFIIAIIVMLAIGVIIGFLNGVSVVFLKMPSFIATMASFLIFSGLALFISKSETIPGLPREFIFIGGGRIFFIPFPIIIAVIVILITNYLLSKTVFGRYIFAIGTNPRTSLISGLPVKSTIVKLFVISGFLAALGGIVMTARVGAGMPSMGQERLIDVATATIIGGTSMFGGVGTIGGVVAGALLITVINNSLDLLGISWFVINIIKGLLILTMAFVDVSRALKK
jgi:ribose/xylose/arabinose/galactoside ABC-type transport system permease subunit